MSHNRPKNEPPPPTGLNPEGFIPYASPYYMYILYYPKLEDPSLSLVGYTVDKVFFDKCLAVGMPGNVIDMQTCSALMEKRMQIVDEANQRYGRPVPGKAPKMPGEKEEVLYWWVTPRGVIDRTRTGDMESTQNLDADKTLGSLAYERLLIKTIKILVTQVPDWDKSVTIAEKRIEQLRVQLEDLEPELTVEDINNLKVPENGSEERLRTQLLELLRLVASDLTEEERQYLKSKE